jgi:hypothetical protein
MVEPYTIGLKLDGGFGTAILCQHQSKFFLLTADHVARAFRSSKGVHLILRFDQFRREYPIKSTKNFTVIEWDQHLDEQKLNDVMANQPKDLAIIIPPQEIIDILKIYKAFYEIQEEAESFSLQDALISLGGIEPKYSMDSNTIELQMGPYAFVASEYSQFPHVDYIKCPVKNHTYEIRNLRRKVIESFQGLSGSGLWKFVKNTPKLVGIAIAQDPDGYDLVTGVRNVYFHGPHSILALLSKFRISS